MRDIIVILVEGQRMEFGGSSEGEGMYEAKEDLVGVWDMDTFICCFFITSPGIGSLIIYLRSPNACIALAYPNF
jgi:hypothetical protein